MKIDLLTFASIFLLLRFNFACECEFTCSLASCIVLIRTGRRLWSSVSGPTRGRTTFFLLFLGSFNAHYGEEAEGDREGERNAVKDEDEDEEEDEDVFATEKEE